MTEQFSTGGGLVAVGPGLATWTEMRGKFDGDTLPYDVTLELVFDPAMNRMVASALTCTQREDGPPVTTEGIRRIPVRDLTRTLVAGNLIDVNRSGAVAILSKEPGELTAAGPTDEALRAVAWVYRIAYLASDSPTAAVSQRFGLSRDTASRWVAMARKRGFLGRAQRRKAGEVVEA